MRADKRRGQALAAIAPPLLVLLLGVSGIGFGLPWRITGLDERLVVESAVSTFSGDWAPIDLRYPTLFIYTIRAGLEPVARWLSASSGERDVGALLFANLASRPTPFYLVGRGLAIAAGVAAVVCLAALSKRLIGERYAWLPASILALTPVFAEFSRYAKVDVPLTLWTVLALLCAVRFHESGRFRDALWTALAVGLALATKWTAALLLPLVAYVALRGSDGTYRLRAREIGRLAVLSAIVVTTVLASTPSLLTYRDKAIGDATRVARHIQEPSQENAMPGYVIYPEALIVSGFGAGFLLVAAYGIAISRRWWNASWLPILAFGTFYFVVIFVAQTATPRYLMPIFPVLALLASQGIVRIAERLSRPVWLVALIAFLPTAPWLASRVIAGATNADTRLQSMAYVETHVPDGNPILIIGGERGTPPLLASNAPPFWNLAWLKAEERLGSVRYQRARAMVLALQDASGRPEYRIDRLERSGAESFLKTKRPAAIVVYDADSAPLPPEAESEYETPVVFRPNWITWWKHTNTVVLRRGLRDAAAPADLESDRADRAGPLPPPKALRGS
jgi:Dolichyl-phosphate-mannose-protein mannosyltransferase